jgi:hypothetical protein
MICAFCDKEFAEEAAEKACGQCSLFGGCKKIKCPHCGYESPKQPESLKWLKKIVKRTK